MRRKFLAAKVNINGSIYNTNVKELIRLIPEAILSYPKLKKTNAWTWSFSEVTEDKEIGFVKGYFVKSRKESKLVLKGNVTVNFEIPDPAAYQSFFVYDYTNEILVFEETAKITREEFVLAFERIIYDSKLEIGEISIQLLPVKDVVLQEIKKIDFLTKVEFDLIHPNPISKDTYKDMDDIIKKEKATRLKVVLENPNGLNKDGNLIESGIEMVQNGYGGVNAYGYSRVASLGKRKKTRKKQQKYKSRDSVQMIHADRDTSSSDLYSRLKDFAISIKNLLL